MTNNNDTAKTLLIESARMLMLKISEDLERIANDNFTDDDTDYMPARAHTLANIIEGLANSDIEPQEALALIIAEGEMSEDLSTTDFRTPLYDLLP